MVTITNMSLSGNPILFPPHEVVITGTKGVMKFLRDKSGFDPASKSGACKYDDYDDDGDSMTMTMTMRTHVHL